MIQISRFMRGGLIGTVAGFFAAGLVMVGQSSEADATLMLRVTQGSHVATATDTNGDGFVAFLGLVGAFDINFTAGTSKPAIGSAQWPQIHLTSLNITSWWGGAAGLNTVKIEITDTDFSLSGTTKRISTDVGGVLGGNMTLATYVDNSNTAFGQGTNVGSMSYSNGAFSGSTSGVASLTNPYSMTMVAMITHNGSGVVSSLDSSVAVNEPGTLALLGIGLVGLGFASRKRQRELAV